MAQRSHRKRWILYTVLAVVVLAPLTLAVLRHHYTLQTQAIPRWSIGKYVFDNQFDILADHPNPVLSSADLQGMEAEFVADPFVYQASDGLYLFYEIGLAHSLGGWTGVIGVASSTNGESWKDLGIALSDSVTLSFPIVYEFGDSIYMTVEGAAADNLRLFRATRFPTAWECVNTLLTGQWSDPVIHEHEGLYYLFTSKPKYHDLHIFYSSSFFGPYTEHPLSPVVKGDPSRGRNAGRIFKVNDAWYRPTQDCAGLYGERVRMLRIDKLSSTEYQETEIKESPVLAGSGSGWNKKKMHTFNVFSQGPQGFSVITDGTPVNYEYRRKLVRRSR